MHKIKKLYNAVDLISNRLDDVMYRLKHKISYTVDIYSEKHEISNVISQR